MLTLECAQLIANNFFKGIFISKQNQIFYSFPNLNYWYLFLQRFKYDFHKT